MIKSIVEDIDTALAKDPAARNRLEVLLTYLSRRACGLGISHCPLSLADQTEVISQDLFKLD